MGGSEADDPTGRGGGDPVESFPDKPHSYGRRFVAKNKKNWGKDKG
jgi:hypothetical protein